MEGVIRANAIDAVGARGGVDVGLDGPPALRPFDDAPRVRPRPRLNRSVLVVLLVAFAASALSVSSAVRGGHLTFHDGCGDDGYTYCTMVVGEPASRPWSRRILLPALVRAVAGEDATLPDLPVVFLWFNIAGLAVAATVTGALAARFTRRARRRGLAAVLAGSFVLVSPLGFRWTWMYPALVDPFAMGFAAAAVLAAISRRPGVRYAAPLLAVGATLSRESWAVVLAIGIAALVGIPRRREGLLLLVPSAIAIGGALLVVVTTPGVRNPVTDRVEYYTDYARYYFTTAHGWRHWTWMTLFCFGVVPLAAVLRPWRGWAWLKDHPERRALGACFAMVSANVVLGFIGGADYHRFMFSIMPFFIAPAVAAALDEAHEWFLAAALLCSCVIWQFWHSPDGTRDGYLEFFSPNYVSERAVADRFRSDVSVAAAFLVLSLDVIIVRSAMKLRRQGVAP